MSDKAPPDTSSDPFGFWESTRTTRESSLDALSQALLNLVNTEAFAELVNTMLSAYLTASTPFKQASEKVMTEVLTASNMPTRTDFVSLARRMTNVEMRLDDLDAQITEVASVLRSLDSSIGKLHETLAGAAAKEDHPPAAPRRSTRSSRKPANGEKR